MGGSCCVEERESEENLEHDPQLEKTIKHVAEQAFTLTGNDPSDVLQEKQDLQVIVRYIRDLDYIFDGLDGEIVNGIWKTKKDGVSVDDIVDWLRAEVRNHEGNIKALLTRASRVLISVQQLPGYGEIVQPMALRPPLKRICKLLGVPKPEWPSADQIEAVAENVIKSRDPDSDAAEVVGAENAFISTEAEDAFIVLLTGVYANYFNCKKRLTPPSPTTSVSTTATPRHSSVSPPEDATSSVGSAGGTSHGPRETSVIGEKSKDEEKDVEKDGA